MILFTIGYEKLDQKQFIAYLSNHGVDVVADIRKLPVSRKKGFSKTALRETLSSKGIDYINYRDLGAPKELRDELYNSGNYYRFFRKYENNISDKTDYLAEILSLINHGRNEYSGTLLSELTYFNRFATEFQYFANFDQH